MKSFRILSSLLLFATFALPATATSFSVPFSIDPKTGTIQVACETESQPGKVLRCTIDSGAQRSVGGSAAVSKASRRGGKFVVMLTPAGVQAAYETQQVLIVGAMKIPVSFEVIANVQRLDADILIGQDFLQQFSSVTIDYKNRVVTFETK
jgi:hypothetical protein